MKIFDEKAEVVGHLDTCDGTADISVILLSVMRKLKTILTTTTRIMIPPCSLCPKIFKNKVEVPYAWYMDIAKTCNCQDLEEKTGYDIVSLV